MTRAMPIPATSSSREPGGSVPCTRRCCLPALETRQCWGCGRLRVRHQDLADLAGIELVDGKLRYDPERARVRVIEDICSADCPGLPEFGGARGRGGS